MDLSVFEHQFYFVCFPPGAGGVHLGNLIALDPTFSPRGLTSHDEYYQKLLEQYASSELWAHAVNHQMFDVNDPPMLIKINQYLSSIDTTKYKNSVHLGRVTNFFNNRYFDNLSKKRVILFTFNDQLSIDLVGKREEIIFTEYSPIHKTGIFNIIAFRYLHSKEYFQKMHGIDDLDLFQLEAKRMFNADITDLLKELNQEFNLNIPLDQATKLHQLWITKNLN